MTRGDTGIVKGAILTVMMRWTDRLIGFSSTLILARLLVPEDFGVIAMASLFIGLVDVFLDFGVHVALIQNRDPTQEHYNTAWTLRIIQTTFATCIVVLFAPLAAHYFKDPRVAPVLWVLAFSFLLSGLENIGVVNFQKEMKFGQDFRFVFLKRIAGFMTTITAAYLLRSYWALVIGNLSGRACGVGLSYLLHPMRPGFSLVKFREIFAVSQWMLVRSSSSYLEINLHKIIVGRRGSPTIMGAYTLADEISAMPTSELLAPLNRVLFPAFVRVKNDIQELKRMFLLAQGVQTLIGIPAGVGLALVGNEVVRLFLGEKWLIAVPFIQILALVNLLTAITTSGGYVLLTLGHIRTLALYSWLQIVLFFVGAFVLFPAGGAIILAWLRLVVVILCFSFFIYLLVNALPNLVVREIFRTVIRPLIAVGVMALCIIAIGQCFEMPLMIALFVKICVGIMSYSSMVLILWRFAKCPQGAEAYLIDKTGLRRYYPFT